MKNKAIVSLMSVAILAVGFAFPAERRPEVRWPQDVSISEADKRHFENMAFDAASALGKYPEKSDYVAVNIDPFMSKKKEGHTFFRLNFFTSNQYYTVACMYPAEESIRLFSDYPLATRKVPYTPTAIHSTEARALERAKEIAKRIGNIDLDDKTQWNFFLRGFVNNDWEFNWRPLINGYPSPGLVFVEIADTEDYGLITFQNAVYSRPNIITEVRIDRQQADKLADNYLHRYYHKHELQTLQFSTNVLEIVVPNYSFTPQDTGYEGWTQPTNPPVLVWKAIYSRTSNTLERTPVQIWVDAADGAMRGGWE